MLTSERITTNWLLLNDLNLWDEFDQKSINDSQTSKYFQIINEILELQQKHSINWLQSKEAEEYFNNLAYEDQEIWESIDKEWETILNNSYSTVNELLEQIYNTGKKQGYEHIQEKIRWTPADREAIRICKDYNFHLIRKLSNDLKNNVKTEILKGIITNENPNSLANRLVEVGIKPLKNSTLSARQRAVMIARTETSRMQNTGMLQSYINEGYTEVKILTAEDNNVCNTCLTYAYEFNESDKVIYENHKNEKVYNIIKLIKNGRFPPFHPNCRCTYLTVWESKRDAPENPYVINLTPLKFLDSDEKYVLPDGKPRILWTEEILENRLKSIVDNETELKEIKSALMDYMLNLKNRNIEYLNAMDNNYNIVCNQHTLKESGGVDLCSKGREAAEKQGLLFVIHNHPSNNILHSQGDINGIVAYDVKYSFIFTEENGIYVIKNLGVGSDNIKIGYADFYQYMSEDYKENNSNEFNHLLDLRYGGLKNEEFHKKLHRNIKNHISNNPSLSRKIFEQKMNKYNVLSINIKP